jgi:hypothetical protein
MEKKLKYVSILNSICNYYGINEEKFIELLKDRDNKYILLLILKNNRCLEIDRIKEVLNLRTSRSINNNLKLAEEKLLINSYFREKYFELENSIENNDITNL